MFRFGVLFSVFAWRKSWRLECWVCWLTARFTWHMGVYSFASGVIVTDGIYIGSKFARASSRARLLAGGKFSKGERGTFCVKLLP